VAKAPKKTKYTSPPLEIIQWLDHSGWFPGWVELQDLVNHVPPQMVSVGWIIRENDVSVFVVPTLHIANNQGNFVIQILKADIVERWTIDDPYKGMFEAAKFELEVS
jgi:hypothetical protein